MQEFVIVAAKRTAIGGFQGTLKDTSAVDLGVVATKAILAGLPAQDIADVIVGNVLQAGNGMNPARQIALRSGLPDEVTAQTINRVCGSGLQAVVSAVQGLQCGEGKLYLAGGTESMSRAPYLLAQARAGYRYGSGELVDSILSEGLTDPTLCYAMGVTAENLAMHCGVLWILSLKYRSSLALLRSTRNDDQGKFGIAGSSLHACRQDRHRDGGRTRHRKGYRTTVGVSGRECACVRPGSTSATGDAVLCSQS